MFSAGECNVSQLKLHFQGDIKDKYTRSFLLFLIWTHWEQSIINSVFGQLCYVTMLQENKLKHISLLNWLSCLFINSDICVECKLNFDHVFVGFCTSHAILSNQSDRAIVSIHLQYLLSLTSQGIDIRSSKRGKQWRVMGRALFPGDEALKSGSFSDISGLQLYLLNDRAEGDILGLLRRKTLGKRVLVKSATVSNKIVAFWIGNERNWCDMKLALCKTLHLYIFCMIIYICK